jgi:hypothetical protein
VRRGGGALRASWARAVAPLVASASARARARPPRGRGQPHDTEPVGLTDPNRAMLTDREPEARRYADRAEQRYIVIGCSGGLTGLTSCVRQPSRPPSVR